MTAFKDLNRRTSHVCILIIACAFISVPSFAQSSLGQIHLSQPTPMPQSLGPIDPEIVADIMSPNTASKASNAQSQAPSVMAPSVMDHAEIALAELNDTADVQAKARKQTLYKQLMEINGTSANVRMIMSNARDVIRAVVIERGGVTSLTPEQSIRFNEIATRILKETEITLIDEIAQSQSKAFSEDEISQLIKSNSSMAAAKYNASKYVMPEALNQKIQSYMVDAVIKIMKTFKQAATT